MMRNPFNVLFICTGNSARSIMAESLLNYWGQGRFRGFSAGSFPKGVVHPFALKLLHSLDLPTEGLRSKSWNMFAQPGSPVMDFVFTVCDSAATECPSLPSRSRGQSKMIHHSFDDPPALTRGMLLLRRSRAARVRRVGLPAAWPQLGRRTRWHRRPLRDCLQRRRSAPLRRLPMGSCPARRPEQGSA